MKSLLRATTALIAVASLGANALAFGGDFDGNYDTNAVIAQAV